MRSLLIASLAASLVAAPVAATAATPDSSASPLSLQGTRAAADLRASSALGGEMDEGAWIGLGVAVAALVMFLIIIIDDDDGPDSP